jgi:hypothetical protein
MQGSKAIASAENSEKEPGGPQSIEDSDRDEDEDEDFEPEEDENRDKVEDEVDDEDEDEDASEEEAEDLDKVDSDEQAMMEGGDQDNDAGITEEGPTATGKSRKRKQVRPSPQALGVFICDMLTGVHRNRNNQREGLCAVKSMPW